MCRTSRCSAWRVASTSTAWLSGVEASPRVVAASRTALVASPARSRSATSSPAVLITSSSDASTPASCPGTRRGWSSCPLGNCRSGAALTAPTRGGDGDEDCTRAACVLVQEPEVFEGHGSVAHPAPVGAAAVDRPLQRRVCGEAGTWPECHRGEVPGVVGVGEPVDGRIQAAGGEGDQQVVQGGSAAQDEVAAVGIGGDEVPGP